MTLREIRRHIGQLVIVGFDGLTVPADLKRLAREFDLGGVILFGRNVDTPAQVADLAAEVATLARELPLWVSVDQEGGRVARLRHGFTEWPPMATLGRSGDEGLAERFARALATELRAVGISLDFAPVMDVLTNPANTVIGDRALADRPELVARLGGIVIRTLQAAGVAACAKHFPGHGDTTTDSHDALPVVEHPPDRLRAVELEPFRAAVAERAAAIMTAHVLVEALDDKRPVTLSRDILQGWLRGDLGYDGLTISDDLGMRAISERYRAEDAALGALTAGCDVALLCGPSADEQVRVLEALIRSTERATLPADRVRDAVRRQREAKGRFLIERSAAAAPPRLDDIVGCEAHREIAREMEQFL